MKNSKLEEKKSEGGKVSKKEEKHLIKQSLKIIFII